MSIEEGGGGQFCLEGKHEQRHRDFWIVNISLVLGFGKYLENAGKPILFTRF